MSRHETLADIVAELRELADRTINTIPEDADTTTKRAAHRRGLAAMRHAQRIEAAWKREKAEIEANALAVGGIVEAERHKLGNAAAMRNALEDVLEKIDRWRTDGVMEHWQYSQLFDIADSALSAPPRQCDVGTAKEQEERFKHFCASNYSACDVDMECCRCHLESEKASCEFAWAQMPYAEEGAGE